MSETRRAGEAPLYRLALLSNAMHQDSYARAFARHLRLRIVAVIDEPGQEPYVVARNRSLAAEYGVPYVESLDALSDPEIDAVSVGAQIERRDRLAVEAARRGKHLWLDKPPAATAPRAEAVAAAVAGAGVTALVFSHLAAPWVVALRRTVQAGAIGDLLALHLDFHFAKGDARGLATRRVPSGTGPRDVWTFRDAAGGATDPTESSHHVIAKRELAEVGWYPLALVQHLCPQPVRRVYATAGAYFFPEHRDLGLEDFATLSLTLDGGPVVTLSTGRTGRRSHPAGRMAVRACGTRGTIALDGGQPALLIHGGASAGAGDERAHRLILAWGDSVGTLALVEHFVACLDGTAAPVLTARQGCALMRVIDGAYESVASGQPVDL
jgi:predicted dehydrogenase